MRMRTFRDAFDAWEFLEDHEMFLDQEGLDHLSECLFIDVVKVNPETMEVDSCEDKNTATRVWLECGPWVEPQELGANQEHFPHGVSSHDPDLDCGAPTFEEALIKLAGLVSEKYGEI